jgi:hypothetical protein
MKVRWYILHFITSTFWDFVTLSFGALLHSSLCRVDMLRFGTVTFGMFAFGMLGFGTVTLHCVRYYVKETKPNLCIHVKMNAPCSFLYLNFVLIILVGVVGQIVADRIGQVLRADSIMKYTRIKKRNRFPLRSSSKLTAGDSVKNNYRNIGETIWNFRLEIHTLRINHNVGFQEYRNFFTEIWSKSPIIVITTLIPGLKCKVLGKCRSNYSKARILYLYSNTCFRCIHRIRAV